MNCFNVNLPIYSAINNVYGIADMYSIGNEMETTEFQQWKGDDLLPEYDIVSDGGLPVFVVYNNKGESRVIEPKYNLAYAKEAIQFANETTPSFADDTVIEGLSLQQHLEAIESVVSLSKGNIIKVLNGEKAFSVKELFTPALQGFKASMDTYDILMNYIQEVIPESIQDEDYFNDNDNWNAFVEAHTDYMANAGIKGFVFDNSLVQEGNEVVGELVVARKAEAQRLSDHLNLRIPALREKQRITKIAIDNFYKGKTGNNELSLVKGAIAKLFSLGVRVQNTVGVKRAIEEKLVADLEEEFEDELTDNDSEVNEKDAEMHEAYTDTWADNRQFKIDHKTSATARVKVALAFTEQKTEDGRNINNSFDIPKLLDYAKVYKDVMGDLSNVPNLTPEIAKEILELQSENIDKRYYKGLIEGFFGKGIKQTTYTEDDSEDEYLSPEETSELVNDLVSLSDKANTLHITHLISNRKNTQGVDGRNINSNRNELEESILTGYYNTQAASIDQEKNKLYLKDKNSELVYYDKEVATQYQAALINFRTALQVWVKENKKTPFTMSVVERNPTMKRHVDMLWQILEDNGIILTTEQREKFLVQMDNLINPRKGKPNPSAFFSSNGLGSVMLKGLSDMVDNTVVNDGKDGKPVDGSYLIVNQNLLRQSAFSKFTKWQSGLVGRQTTDNFRNEFGDTVYAYSNPSHLTDIFNTLVPKYDILSLQERRTELIENLRKDPFSKHSVYLNMLIEDSAEAVKYLGVDEGKFLSIRDTMQKHLGIYQDSALSMRDSDLDAMRKKNMGLDALMKTSLIQFQNSGLRGGGISPIRIAYYDTPAHSDNATTIPLMKSVAFDLSEWQMITYDETNKTYKLNHKRTDVTSGKEVIKPNMDSSDIQLLASQILMPDLQRIVSFSVMKEIEIAKRLPIALEKRNATADTVETPLTDSQVKADVIKELQADLYDAFGKQYVDGAEQFHFVPSFTGIFKPMITGQVAKEVNEKMNSEEPVNLEGIDGETGQTRQSIVTEAIANKVVMAIMSTNQPLIETEKLLVEMAKNTLDKWKANGTVKANNEGIINSFDFFDAEYIRKVLNGKGNKNEQAFFAALDINFNTLIANANYFMLAGGDIAQYYKQGSTEQQVTKRLASDIASKQKGNFPDDIDGKYNVIYLKDSKSNRMVTDYTAAIDEKVGKAYEGVKGTDAQELTTWREHLDVMRAYGKISDFQYKELEKKIPAQTLTEADMKLILQPMKPVQIAAFNDEKFGYRMRKKAYLKSSSFPLIPQITKGLAIDELRLAMEGGLSHNSNKIQRAIYESGAKLMTKSTVSLWKMTNDGTAISDINREGLTSQSLASKIESLPRTGFGIQVEKPYKGKKDEVRVITQMDKGLFSNTLGANSLYDNLTFMQDNEEKSAKELFDYKEQLKVSWIRREAKALKERLNVRDVDMGYGTEYELDMPVLRDILLAEMTSRSSNYSDTEKEFVKSLINNEFEFPLAFTYSADKFETLLQSLITNNIMKQKINGTSFIQGSSVGFMTLSDLTFAEQNQIRLFEGKTLEGGLKFVTFGSVKEAEKREGGTEIVVPDELFGEENEEEGFTATVGGTKTKTYEGEVQLAQVLIPSRLKDKDGNIVPVSKLTKQVEVTNEDGTKRMVEVLDNDKIPKELRNMVTARIPNQGHSSMLLVEIIGFLPESMGDLILVPEEITTAQGSDFDVDMLYAYIMNHSWNNKEQKFEVLKVPDTIEAQYQEFYEEQLQEKANWAKEKLLGYFVEKKDFGNSEEVMKAAEDYIALVEDTATYDVQEDIDFKNELEEDIKKAQKEYNQLKITDREMELKFLEAEITTLDSKIKELEYDTKKDKGAVISNKEKQLKRNKNAAYRNFVEKFLKEEMIKAKYLPTLEEFQELDKTDRMTVKQLQNEYIKIHHTVLSHPAIAKKSLRPLQLEDLYYQAGRRDNFGDKITSIPDLSVSTYSTMLAYENQLEKYKNGVDGKGIGVGIEAVMSTFANLAEGKNIVLSYRSKDEILPQLVTIGEIANFPLEFNISEKGAYKSSQNDDRSNIDTIQNIFLNAAVDNANELLFPTFNMNSTTLNVANLLALMRTNYGKAVPVDFIVRYISQPIIRDYVKYLNNKKDPTNGLNWTEKQALFKELVKKYTPKKEQEKKAKDSGYKTTWDEISGKSDISLPQTIESLGKSLWDFEDNRRDTDTMQDYWKTDQLSILNSFQKLEKYATTLMGMANAINIESKGVGKSLMDNRENSEKLYKAFFSGKFSHKFTRLNEKGEPYEGLESTYNVFFDESGQGALLREGMALDNKLFEQIFPFQSPVMEQIFTEVLTYHRSFNEVEDPDEERVVSGKLRKEIWNKFKSFLFADVNKTIGSNLFDDIYGTGNIRNHRRNLFRGLHNEDFNIDSLGEELLKLIRSPEGSKNLFLNRLTIDTPLGGLHTVKYNNTIEDATNDYEVTQSLRSLYQSHPATVKRLLQYAYLANGTMTSGSFLKFFTPDLQKEFGVEKILQTAHTFITNNEWNGNNEKERIIKEFVRQYFQHNIEEVASLGITIPYNKGGSVAGLTSSLLKDYGIIVEPTDFVSRTNVNPQTGEETESNVLYVFNDKGEADKHIQRSKEDNRASLVKNNFVAPTKITIPVDSDYYQNSAQDGGIVPEYFTISIRGQKLLYQTVSTPKIGKDTPIVALLLPQLGSNTNSIQEFVKREYTQIPMTSVTPMGEQMADINKWQTEEIEEEVEEETEVPEEFVPETPKKTKNKETKLDSKTYTQTEYKPVLQQLFDEFSANRNSQKTENVSDRKLKAIAHLDTQLEMLQVILDNYDDLNLSAVSTLSTTKGGFYNPNNKSLTVPEFDASLSTEDAVFVFKTTLHEFGHAFLYNKIHNKVNLTEHQKQTIELLEDQRKATIEHLMKTNEKFKEHYPKWVELEETYIKKISELGVSNSVDYTKAQSKLRKEANAYMTKHNLQVYYGLRNLDEFTAELFGVNRKFAELLKGIPYNMDNQKTTFERIMELLAQFFTPNWIIDKELNMYSAAMGNVIDLAGFTPKTEKPAKKVKEKMGSNDLESNVPFSGGHKGGKKGTPSGDGKDIYMRGIADGFIGEIKDANKKVTSNLFNINSDSSSLTSMQKIGVKNGYKEDYFLSGDSVSSGKLLLVNDMAQVVMLARNKEFSGKSLLEDTKKSIADAHEEGVSFAVGDMPNVDSQFIEYLMEINANFTIYSTDNNIGGRIKTQMPALWERIVEYYSTSKKDNTNEGVPFSNTTFENSIVNDCR